MDRLATAARGTSAVTGHVVRNRGACTYVLGRVDMIVSATDGGGE